MRGMDGSGPLRGTRALRRRRIAHRSLGRNRLRALGERQQRAGEHERRPASPPASASPSRAVRGRRRRRSRRSARRRAPGATRCGRRGSRTRCRPGTTSSNASPMSPSSASVWSGSEWASWADSSTVPSAQPVDRPPAGADAAQRLVAERPAAPPASTRSGCSAASSSRRRAGAERCALALLGADHDRERQPAADRRRAISGARGGQPQADRARRRASSQLGRAPRRP